MRRGRILLAALVGAQLAVVASAHADVTPTSNALAPASTKATIFDVPYQASDAGGPGLAEVDLYAKAPGEATYAEVATDTTPDTPSFSYSATAGNGSYAFYTVAVDTAGNREPAPATPDSTTQVQSPLVAAITMPPNQKLGDVLEKGLLVRLYAYRPVSLRLALVLQPKSAKTAGLRNAQVATRSLSVTKPATYDIRVHVKTAAANRLWLMKSARFELRTVLSTQTASSKASTRFVLTRL